MPSFLVLPVVVIVLSFAGCLSPLALHEAVIEYDRTANRIQSDMLLLNIGRAHNFQPLHFTAVSSVAATFDFAANAGIFPSQAERNPSIVAPGLGVSVAERPTITIVPIEGEDFLDQAVETARIVFDDPAQTGLRRALGVFLQQLRGLGDR